MNLDGRALVQSAEEPEVKEILRRETEAAVERGVFGIPTMIVENELFWGLDQLRYLELHLEGKDPLSSVNWEEWGYRGPSAWRTGRPRYRTSTRRCTSKQPSRSSPDDRAQDLA